MGLIAVGSSESLLAIEEAVAFSDSHNFLCMYACVLCVSMQACAGNVWLLCFPLSNGAVSTWSRGAQCPDADEHCHSCHASSLFSFCLCSCVFFFESDILPLGVIKPAVSSPKLLILFSLSTAMQARAIYELSE